MAIIVQGNIKVLVFCKTSGFSFVKNENSYKIHETRKLDRGFKSELWQCTYLRRLAVQMDCFSYAEVLSYILISKWKKLCITMFKFKFSHKLFTCLFLLAKCSSMFFKWIPYCTVKLTASGFIAMLLDEKYSLLKTLHWLDARLVVDFVPGSGRITQIVRAICLADDAVIPLQLKPSISTYCLFKVTKSANAPGYTTHNHDDCKWKKFTFSIFHFSDFAEVRHIYLNWTSFLKNVICLFSKNVRSHVCNF